MKSFTAQSCVVYSSPCLSLCNFRLSVLLNILKEGFYAFALSTRSAHFGTCLFGGISSLPLGLGPLLAKNWSLARRFRGVRFGISCGRAARTFVVRFRMEVHVRPCERSAARLELRVWARRFRKDGGFR